MTVPIIENWTNISGTVENAVMVNEPRDHVAITLRLDSVAAVEAFPNLLKASTGELVTVLARSQSRAWKVGMKAAGLVRRVGIDRLFAHPDFAAPED